MRIGAGILGASAVVAACTAVATWLAGSTIITVFAAPTVAGAGRDYAPPTLAGNAAAREQRVAVRFRAFFNRGVELTSPGRGSRIVEIRCRVSSNGRFYCHALFRPVGHPRSVRGEFCEQVELQSPRTLLRLWPVVCDDGTGAVLAPMPRD